MLSDLMRTIRNRDLYAWVFVTGAIVLIIEVVAVRILAPFFGNTLFSVSSVLSVVLLALSAGYWVGGNLADKNPRRNLFYTIILSSGVLLLILEVFRASVLEFISDNTSIVSGPLVSSIVLFIGPAFLLGMLSPLAIKIKIDEDSEIGVGRITGGMFFWSTLGSILGSLLAGFYLIPAFGVDQIMLSIGVVLIIMGATPLILSKRFSARTLAWFIFGVIVLFFAAVGSRPLEKGNVVYAEDGIYEKVTVLDGTYNGENVRFLLQDRNTSAARYPDSEDLVFDYSKYYKLFEVFDIELERTVVLGGGAYSIPRALLDERDQPIVDVVEIEPTLFEISQKYFGLPDSDRLQNHVIDGRRFLADSEDKYDLIFGDVFLTLLSIPSHFTTVEFFELVHDRLDDDGIFISNLVGDTFDVENSFTFSEIRTVRSVFPNSYFFAVRSADREESQNIIMMARKGNAKEPIDFDALRSHSNPVLANLEEQLIELSDEELATHQILTDNYAPIDFLVAQQLNRRTDK